jgi:pimeloyl-ACP methyl ester carboxylesterase
MAVTPYHPFRSEASKQRYLTRYDEIAKRWPVPSEARMVDTSWGQTFVRVSGPADGPPIVLLPGVGSPCHTWIANIAALSERFQTFAVDNIHDHGRSVESRVVASADDFASWLDELLSALGLESGAHFVGLSYGGWISAHYALRHPERVGRLVLLAPAGTVAPIPWGFIWRGILCSTPARRFMFNFMAWIAPSLEHGDEPQRQMLDAMVDDAWLAMRCFARRKLVPPLPLSEAELGRLPRSTLFLVGEQEVIFEPRQALARLARVAPHVRAELVPGCGHDLFIAQAAEGDRRIVAFLSED